MVYKKFLSIQGVESVNATRAKGVIKHYNIRIKANNKKVISELERFWPFGVISAGRDVFYADYIVKPNELDMFYARLSQIPFYIKKNEVAIIFQLDYPASDELKRQLISNVRSDDRLVWSDKGVALIIQDCSQQTIEAVKKRIEKLLSLRNYTFNVSVHAVS